jgi:hypothetical protein
MDQRGRKACVCRRTKNLLLSNDIKLGSNGCASKTRELIEIEYFTGSGHKSGAVQVAVRCEVACWSNFPAHLGL